MRIAFQGTHGAYSELAVLSAFPSAETVPCLTFERAIAAVSDGIVDRAFLPCENSLHGRVAGIHRLLPESGLCIVGEHFQRVEHCLLAPAGATLQTIRHVHSQDVALGQVRRLIERHGYQEVMEADTAEAARVVAELGDITHAAVASSLAGRIHGLLTISSNVEDEFHNTTRFYVVSRTRSYTPFQAELPTLTTFMFRVRNEPASLFKVLVGLSTTGTNMTKLESYMLDGRFVATQFLCEVEGHPDEARVAVAMRDVAHHAERLDILGVYPADRYRRLAETAS